MTMKNLPIKQPFSEEELFCQTYNIKPRHTVHEIAIWRLVYGASGFNDVCYVTYFGTYLDATRKLLYLAKRNNTFTPSSTGYSCNFRGFRIEDSGCKISQGLARMIRSAGGYVRAENIDY